VLAPLLLFWLFCNTCSTVVYENGNVEFLTQILIHVAALIGILCFMFRVSRCCYIGYKTFEAAKITIYVNPRTTLEARKGKRKGFCCFPSLWCTDGLSSCCKWPVIAIFDSHINCQDCGMYDGNYPTIKPVKYLNLKSYTDLN
jgi:hypothetical protein